MYAYVGLCRVVYVYVGLCIAMEGYIWLCMPMYDYVWLCRVMYSYIGLCMLMYAYVLFYCVRGTRTQPLICVGCSVHCWVSCAINKGRFFEIAFSSSTHFCLALRRLVTFCLTLTN